MVNKLQMQIPTMTLNLFGDWAVIADDQPIIVKSTKAQALLVYLAMTSRIHKRLALAGLLWPDKQDKDALANLRQVLYTLRQAVPGLLVATREWVGLQQARQITVDVHQFEAATRHGLAGDVDALCTAADWYRGDLLHGFYVEQADPFEEWLRGERERLHRLAFQVLRQLTAYFVAQRATQHGIRYAEQLIALEPWHEESHYQLIQLLAWSGQIQAALAQYERCRDLLATELNTTPSAEIETLIAALRQGFIVSAPEPIRYQQSAPHKLVRPHELEIRHVGHNRVANARNNGNHTRIPTSSHTATAPHRPSTAGPETMPEIGHKVPRSVTSTGNSHNLPTYGSTFVGRIEDVAKLCAALRPPAQSTGSSGHILRQRLITLVGPGGVGKTRLAQQVGLALLPDCPDGVWFIDLVAIQDTRMVPQAVADVLGIDTPHDGNLMNALSTDLATKTALLIFDNCEHLPATCTNVIDQLLDATAHVQIIATSRALLHSASESPFPVQPLSLPRQTAALTPTVVTMYDAVDFFVTRATVAMPAFELTVENCTAVVAICRMLDGLPLAMELVAARTRILTVEQIAEQLQTDASAQLRLAAQQHGRSTPRHQTLRSMIAWSYRLLTKAEQWLLQQIALFTSSCTYPALEQIYIHPTSIGNPAHIQPASAEIGSELLVDLLHSLVDKSLVIAEPVGTVMRYRLLESIRQYALEQLRESDIEIVLCHRHLDYYLNFVAEMEAARAHLTRAEWLAIVGRELENVRFVLRWALQSARARDGLIVARGVSAYWFTRGLHRESINWLERLLAVPDPAISPPLRLRTLSDLEFTYWWILEEFSKAVPLQQEVLALALTLHDETMIEKTLNNMGGVAARCGDYTAARQHLQRSLARSVQSNNQINQAWSYILLGETELGEGDAAQAKVCFEKAVIILQALQAKNLLAYPLRRLGYLALHEGDHTQSLTYILSSLELNSEVGELEGQCAALVAMAQLLRRCAQPTLAIQLCCVVDRHLRGADARLPFFERDQFTTMRMQLKQENDTIAFADAWTQGNAMSIDDAIASVDTWATTAFPQYLLDVEAVY